MFRIGDKVRFIDGHTWAGLEGLTEFTIKGIEGNEFTIEEDCGYSWLSKIERVKVQVPYINTGPMDPIEWTDEKEEELNKVLDKLRILEKQKEKLVTQQRAEEVHNQKAFLTDLAAVLSKHKVAVCADVLDNDKVHAEVFYQFMAHDFENDLYTYRNGRSHSTGGEYTCRLEQIK